MVGFVKLEVEDGLKIDGESCGSINVTTHLEHVSRVDKYRLMCALSDALEFEDMDWVIMLAMKEKIKGNTKQKTKIDLSAFENLK